MNERPFFQDTLAELLNSDGISSLDAPPTGRDAGGMTDAYDEPAGVAARGTVLVAAGRGETAEIYGRFGKRISADGYRVRVLPDVAADLGASFAAAGKLLVDDALPGPKVIVGSHTGALFGLALAARRAPGLDALIVAGLPIARPGGINL